MRPVAALFAVLAATAGLGCAGFDFEQRRSPQAISSAELGWVTRFAEWRNAFYEDAERAYQARIALLAGDIDAGEARERIRRSARCSKRLDRLGDPPGRRLDGVTVILRRACRLVERAARLQIRSLNGDPSRFTFETEKSWREGGELVFLAGERVDRLIADDRPLPVRSKPSGESRIEPVYGRLATRLARQRNASGAIEVRCWSAADWEAVNDIVLALDPDTHVDYLDGIADRETRRVSLGPQICDGLAALVYDAPGDREAVADAVLTFAHEVEHVVAPYTEAETQCHALQDMRQAARLLGASAAEAAELARIAWTDLYPDYDEEYRTQACRNGGPLDRNPHSDRWP